jgi:hypothetical protein
VPPFGLAQLVARELCAQAGGDPWQLDDELQQGDAAAIDAQATAFHQTGNHVYEGKDDFDKAKEQFQEGHRRNRSEHPIAESDEVSRATARVDGHREHLRQIGGDLEKVAVALQHAQLWSHAAIVDLDQKLLELDAQIDAAEAANQNSGPLRLAAAGAVQEALKKIRALSGAYAGKLRDAETALMAEGYVPDVLDDIDGVAHDGPADAAEAYERSGQRSMDQRVVNEAKGAGKSDAVSLVGRPGGLTQQEADAAARLRDYRLVTDQSINDAGRNAVDVHERAAARRLAGERLGDYNVASSNRPAAPDPVLGGDARGRAKARLDLQHKLENGGLSWSAQPMTPDQATHTIDTMEANDRANVLARVQDQLQRGGMSPGGAAQVVEGLTQGKIPDEYLEGASAAGKAFEAGEKGTEKFAELQPTGKHWAPGVAYSPEDIESLKKFGSHIGRVGSALELGATAYELFIEHQSPGEVGAKAAGGFGGMWAGAEGGGAFGAFVGGPPGAFLGALFGGTAGAFGGEWLGKHGYKWLTE